MLSLLLVATIAQVDLLNFDSDNTDHGSPTSCAVAAMQVQEAIRTGSIDVTPLSVEYVLRKAGQESFRDTITANHGISSGRYLWQRLHDFGSCPLSMCETKTRRITDAMDVAAYPYHAGDLLGLDSVPTFSAAVAHIAENVGDCVLITTDGYQAYLMIGVDEFGNGIVLDFYSTGQARLQYLNTVQGEALWHSMIDNKDFTPANYVTVFVMRW